MEKITEVYGYKAFDDGLVNRYGSKFEVGKIYTQVGDAKFGNQGNGFHMCTNLEDTIRYFDSFKGNIEICKVRLFGDMVEYCDEYNGYYDMYAGSNIEILSKMSRKDIVDEMLALSNEDRISRFIMGYKMTDKELSFVVDKWKANRRVLECIKYYQLDIEENLKKNKK